jgi:hypothetical protein
MIWLDWIVDKHGQLGIWDARAPPDEANDEDEDISPREDKEGGKYWRLQHHWPATPKSSISCIKFDPIDAHSVRAIGPTPYQVQLTYLLSCTQVPMIAQSAVSLSPLVSRARYSPQKTS